MDDNEYEIKRGKIRAQLVEDFSFDSDGFSKPIEWVNGVGLSRIKKFSNRHASLFKIGVVDEQLRSSSRVSVWVSVNYGEEFGEGIKYGSERKISDPVDVDFRDEFFYDIPSNKFYHGEKEITPQNLFRVVEEAHTRPTKPIRGFRVRSRLWFWRKLVPYFIRLIDIFLVWLLLFISGEKVNEDIFNRLMGLRGIEKIKEPIPTEFEEAKRMDFFGYKAKRWSVIFYCGLHLVIFAVVFFLNIHSTVFSRLFSSNFLILCYVVVTFAVTEAIVPLALRSAIKKITPVAFGYIAFKRVKI